MQALLISNVDYCAVPCTIRTSGFGEIDFLIFNRNEKPLMVFFQMRLYKDDLPFD